MFDGARRSGLGARISGLVARPADARLAIVPITAERRAPNAERRLP